VQLHVSLVFKALLKSISDDISSLAKRCSLRKIEISVASISIFLLVLDSMSILKSLSRSQQIMLLFEIALERSKNCWKTS
jgi:hypothetical protein